MDKNSISSRVRNIYGLFGSCEIKCVFGLYVAFFNCYMRVCGAEVSKAKQFSLIFEKNQHKSHGVLACHVDNFLWGGSNESEKNVINKTRKAFVVGKGKHGENAVFSYVEIELSNLVNSNSKK